ncbi:phosphopantetheine-binding protein, partial [Aquimarina muelleri]
VLAREDTKGNNRLVGYVVMSERDTLDKSELQKHLKSSLPEYMVPQLWVELEDLPLTPNGKIDKKALPEVDDTHLSTQQYVGPRTETEKQLVSIWQELLGVDQVGVYDDFFELGGHSLLATRLVSMVRKVFDIEVSIREVFEHTKIEGQAALIEFFNLDLDEDEDDQENYNETIEI